MHGSPPRPWHAHSGFDLHSYRRRPGPWPTTAEARASDWYRLWRLLAAVCAKYVPKFQTATAIPGGRKHDVSEPVATLLLLLQLLQVVHAHGGNGRSIGYR